MSIEEEIDLVAGTIRNRASGWSEEDITVDQVAVIEAFLIGEVQALASDLRLLLAAKGKPTRKFSFDLAPAVPPAPVVSPFPAPSPAPVGPAVATPRRKFQGRLVGTKEPVLADDVETPLTPAPRLTAEQEAKVLKDDVGFISD